MSDARSEARATPGGDGAGEPSATLVREPQQARSRKTLRRIVDASFHILEQEGPDALTVTGITKRARTSVGSFYARFQGKEDLLRYLGERSLEQAAEEWEDVRAKLPSDGDLRGSARDIVTGLSWLYLESAGRALVMLHGIEDPSPTRRRRLEDRIAGDLRSVFPAAEVRANLATRIVTGVLHDVALQSHVAPTSDGEGSPYPHTPILLSELVELIVGYLGGQEAAAAGEPKTTQRAAGTPSAPEPTVGVVGGPEAAPPFGTNPWDEPAGELRIPHEWEPEPTREREAALEPTSPPAAGSDESAVPEDVVDADEAPPAEVSVAPEREAGEAKGPAEPGTEEEEEETEPDPFDVWG